jgi:hypothetical protein
MSLSRPAALLLPLLATACPKTGESPRTNSIMPKATSPLTFEYQDENLPPYVDQFQGPRQDLLKDAQASAQEVVNQIHETCGIMPEKNIVYLATGSCPLNRSSQETICDKLAAETAGVELEDLTNNQFYSSFQAIQATRVNYIDGAYFYYPESDPAFDCVSSFVESHSDELDLRLGGRTPYPPFHEEGTDANTWYNSVDFSGSSNLKAAACAELDAYK